MQFTNRLSHLFSLKCLSYHKLNPITSFLQIRFNSSISASKDKTVRVSKALSRIGYCSRREAEKLIDAKRVSIDDNVITQGQKVELGKQTIKVDGIPIIAPKNAFIPDSANPPLISVPLTKLFVHYKKRGVLVTHNDPMGRQTLFSHLERMGLPRLVSVGRLDMNSEGLLLLTNNGELARYLELPSNGWKREYRVRAFGHLDDGKREQLKKEGIKIEGMQYKPMKVENVKSEGGKDEEEERFPANKWFSVVLTEGKNREIRRVFEHLGLEVSRIIRIRFGDYDISGLQLGDTVEVPLKGELKKFKN